MVLTQAAVVCAFLVALALCILVRALTRRPVLPDTASTETSTARHMLERVIEEGFDGIVILNGNDEIVRLNGNAHRLLRLANSAAPARPIHSSLPPIMAEEIRAVRRSLDQSRRGSSIREAEIGGSPGELRWLEFTVTPITLGAETRETYLCLTLRDITDRRRAAEHVQRMAMRDSLTGLVNRRGLAGAVARIGADWSSGIALIYFDLDRFKTINDGLGHGVGDQLLIQLSRRAMQSLGGNDVLARLGGDQFAALSFGSPEEALWRAEALLDDLSRPFAVSGHRLSIGVSIGLACCPEPPPDLVALMQQADLALYDAKSRGGRRISVFHPGLEQGRRERLALEQDMAGALDRGEMQIVYQPQVLIGSGDLVGVEALMRWQHPERGFIPPSVFIPLAEETGLIHRLTEWLVNTACANAAKWPSSIMLAVNISPADLQSGEVPRIVVDALARSGLPPDRLELEITETAFVRGGPAVEETFHKVRALGVAFALDDFGTGYSSLSYLHKYPFAKLKIDRSFVSGIPRDEQAMAILRSTIMLAQGLGLRTIAEGVETDEQRATLQLLGCQYAQGYLFSKPIDNAALARMLMLDARSPWSVRHTFNAAG